MKIPLLDLSAHHQPLRQKLLDAMARVLDSQTFILGPEVERLEARMAEYCGVASAVGVSSGTDALLLALMALEVGAGDEVITTPYSFFATAGAVSRMGARPVFVDIDPFTYNINPARIERAITRKTKAILPVHLYGQCAEMIPILEVAQRHRLSVIEDAAQAIGAEYKDGRRAGCLGRVGCFSFFPSKNLGALGDGGLVVTQDAALGEKMRVLRVHGAQPKYHHKWIGGNFRLDALQAAIVNVKLAFLDSWTQKRQENARRYREIFQASGLLEKGLVRMPPEAYAGSPKAHHHIYNQFVVRAVDRDKLWAHLKKNDVGSEVYYPVPLHLQECFRSLGYKAGDFPEAEKAAQETLALPVYPEITPAMQERVVDVIKEFYR
jgi:dTDP-4-amino-4,6-dideoxygalactose transaminase